MMEVSDNAKGLGLAVASSAFIGASFILKKIGLLRAAKCGARAGGGGYTYLSEPLWWAGMSTMLLGEVANFVAYIFAPAVLVTPLGALSIIVSSVLAHFVLKERLEKLGVLGCVSCIVGSVVVVIHAPEEHMPNSVEEIWNLATQPGFLAYALTTLLLVGTLVLFFEPRYGQTNILIYLGICSSTGSLTVVSIKAIGVAIKLTLDGALDTFNLAIVSPIYYVTFTTLTIVASGIMFKDWAGQSLSSIVSELCGLITILSGTILLHTAEEGANNSAGILIWLNFLFLQNASCCVSERPFVLSRTPNASNFMKETVKLFYEDSKLYATKKFELSKTFPLISALLPWPLDKGSISWCISLSSDNLLKNVEEDYFAPLQNSPAPV
ncbi:putative magnesium transporter NIPA6 [Dichanthelium oligosanthes]|uniref:Probable magnesium transporter n=1 Tax=Dichanthelium oligosanthes TaxID=888268 RepID=A0A1E5VLI7_9POAL|nr:putative magnesium transporter NIPA6 [Dichanthelium oligosanthes]